MIRKNTVGNLENERKDGAAMILKPKLFCSKALGFAISGSDKSSTNIAGDQHHGKSQNSAVLRVVKRQPLDVQVVSASGILPPLSPHWWGIPWIPVPAFP
jgi:hypothetical protein